MTFYTDAQRQLQRQFDTQTLADAVQAGSARDFIDDNQKAFIESRDFFFLSTVNGQGEPTVSYKGGGVATVRVIDEKTLVFPAYDGNGMFLSMGNIKDTAKIGLLFIDFETPNRVRVQATATVHDDDLLLAEYPGAMLLVRARVDVAFVNCARYIHKHERLETSRYVPDTDGQQPFPAWKRIDKLQEQLPPQDQGRADAEGGVISQDEYFAKVRSGDS